MRSRFAVTDLLPDLPEAGGPGEPRRGSAPAAPPEPPLATGPGEAERLELLQRLAILDTLPEQVYDDIVRLASSLCGTPVSLVSLVDRDRQWFKARLGLDVEQTERRIAFCHHAIQAADAVFVVEDAHDDPRFATNPLVTGGPRIRFYAGAPIRMPGGEALGTVCVIDSRPRGLAPAEREALAALARQTGALLALRLEQQRADERARLLAQQSESARIERRRSAELLEMVLRGGDLGFWDLHVPSGAFRANPREYEIVGREPGAGDTRIDWRSLVHPDDRPLLDAAMAPHLAGETDSYGCEHRLRHRDGHWVWVHARAVIVDRAHDGSPLRIVGTHMDISARVDSLHALQKATGLLERMGAMSHIGGWELEVATGRVTWTDEVYRIHGVDRSVDPRLLDALGYYPSPGREVLERSIDRAIRFGEPYDLELSFVDAVGLPRIVRTQGEAVRAGGATERLIGTFQDITDQKSTEQAAVESRRRLTLITDNVPALIAYIDADERYRFVNATLRQLLATRDMRPIGRTLREVRGEANYEAARPHVAAALRGEKGVFAFTDETFGRPMRMQSTFVPDIDAQGQVRGFFTMTIDITELWESQRRLEALASVDPLTGLPNRRQLDERLAEAIRRARRTGGTLALLFLDIDRFKSINDELGHAAGDAVLQEFARRLALEVRTTDTVARVAGDEFVVLAENAGEMADVRALGQKIVDAMDAPFALPGATREVTTSIGIAIARGSDAPTGADLLARADAALYRVKRQGRDGFAVDAG